MIYKLWNCQYFKLNLFCFILKTSSCVHESLLRVIEIRTLEFQYDMKFFSENLNGILFRIIIPHLHDLFSIELQLENRFDDNNYDTWKFCMEFILIDENLWGIVDESLFRLAIINNQFQWDIGEREKQELSC